MARENGAQWALVVLAPVVVLACVMWGASTKGVASTSSASDMLDDYLNAEQAQVAVCVVAAPSVGVGRMGADFMPESSLDPNSEVAQAIAAQRARQSVLVTLMVDYDAFGRLTTNERRRILVGAHVYAYGDNEGARMDVRSIPFGAFTRAYSRDGSEVVWE